MTKTQKNLLIDLIILALSIAFAIWLHGSTAFEHILVASRESKFLASLVGGLFFTSIFTTAPAIVILVDVAHYSSPIYVALIGGVGALIGDLIMFKFLRDRLAKDFYALFHIDMNQRYFRLPRFRWLIFILAGIVIASPFPDELGLAMLGFSNTSTKLVIPLSLVFNSLGIFVIALIGNL